MMPSTGKYHWCIVRQGDVCQQCFQRVNGSINSVAASGPRHTWFQGRWQGRKLDWRTVSNWSSKFVGVTQATSYYNTSLFTSQGCLGLAYPATGHLRCCVDAVRRSFQDDPTLRPACFSRPCRRRHVHGGRYHQLPDVVCTTRRSDRRR